MKFFITEQGDICHQLPTASARLKAKYLPGDALLCISKNADNKALQKFLLSVKDFTIFHATITGFGGTEIEPGVSTPDKTLRGIRKLIKIGFPTKQIVLRIDPIIPTSKGITTAQKIIQACPDEISRIRFSFIDGYKNIKNYLPWSSFHAPIKEQKAAMSMLYKEINNKSLEACGEPQLKENKGCISTTDYALLNLPIPKLTYKKQRKGCLCLGNKTELLTKPYNCSNSCKYCYYYLNR